MPSTSTTSLIGFVSMLMPFFYWMFNNYFGTDIDADTANQTFTQVLENFNSKPLWLQRVLCGGLAVAVFFFFIYERCCMTSFKKLAKDEDLDENELCTMSDRRRL